MQGAAYLLCPSTTDHARVRLNKYAICWTLMRGSNVMVFEQP